MIYREIRYDRGRRRALRWTIVSAVVWAVVWAVCWTVVLGMPRLWYIPTDLYEAHRPSAEITRSYLTTHNRQGLA